MNAVLMVSKFLCKPVKVFSLDKKSTDDLKHIAKIIFGVRREMRFVPQDVNNVKYIYLM